MKLAQLIPAAMIVVVMSGLHMVVAADDSGRDGLVAQEQRIEIVIRDSEFLLTQPAAVQVGMPTVIVLRNQDIVRHGFTSPMLAGLPITADSEGMTAHGNGIGGLYINPDKVVVIRFMPEQPGQFSFRCDLHPEMKGEVFLLELGRV